MQNKKRCIIAFIISTAIVVSSFIGVLTGLFEPPAVISGLQGIGIFRYYTVLSNVLVNICAILCIPFEIDGIRKQNYHLPRWIVDILYTGVTNTTITFLISLTLIAPIYGFKDSLLTGYLLYLHLICPILALFLFLFVNVDHKIKASRIVYANIPLVIYMVVYIVNVFIITEERGGWIDHYAISNYMSVWLSALLVIIAGFVVSILLRREHNWQHQKNKKQVEDFYLQYKENSTILEAITNIAREDRKNYKEGNIEIPVHIIKVLKKVFNSNSSDEELYSAYLKAFMKDEFCN